MWWIYVLMILINKIGLEMLKITDSVKDINY